MAWSIPVDLKGIYEAGAKSSDERNATVHVSIFVDVSAAGEVVDALRAAFRPKAANARLSIASYDKKAPALPAEGGLVVVAAGDSPATAELLNAAGKAHLDCVTCTGDLPATVSALEAAGFSPTLSAIVAYETPAGKRSFEERLGEWVVEHCADRRLPLAYAFDFLRKPYAEEIVKATALQNGAFGAILLIPGADMPVMTLNQCKMIIQIAAAYGEKLGPDRIQEILAVVGGGFACRAVARQAAAFVPGAGWAVKAGVGYSGTIAMGRAAVKYFETGTASRVSSAFERVRTKALGAAEAASEDAVGADASSDAAKGAAAKVAAVAGHVTGADPAKIAAALGVAGKAASKVEKIASKAAKGAEGGKDKASKGTKATKLDAAKVAFAAKMAGKAASKVAQKTGKGSASSEGVAAKAVKAAGHAVGLDSAKVDFAVDVASKAASAAKKKKKKGR